MEPFIFPNQRFCPHVFITLIPDPKFGLVPLSSVIYGFLKDCHPNLVILRLCLKVFSGPDCPASMSRILHALHYVLSAFIARPYLTLVWPYPVFYPAFPFLTLALILPYFLYLTWVFTTQPCSVLLGLMLGDPLFSWTVFLSSFCCIDTIKPFFDPLYSFVSMSLNSPRYSTCFRLPILSSLRTLYLLRWSMLLSCPVIINWNLRISQIKVYTIFSIHLFYLWSISVDGLFPNSDV